VIFARLHPLPHRKGRWRPARAHRTASSEAAPRGCKRWPLSSAPGLGDAAGDPQPTALGAARVAAGMGTRGWGRRPGGGAQPAGPQPQAGGQPPPGAPGAEWRLSTASQRNALCWSCLDALLMRAAQFQTAFSLLFTEA